MQSWPMRIYSRLPAGFRSVAATVQGAYLRTLRYGPDTCRMAAEALDRDGWSPERLRAWQADQMATMLHHAATEVPYYREHWTARRRKGDQSSWEQLENWPVLEKEAVRQRPEAFIAGGCERRRLILSQTSGSTGTPLRVWQARETVRMWYALFEARWRRWYGITRHDRWAILGGQLVVPAAQQRSPFWVWNAAFRQLYMSAYHLAPDSVPAYLDAIRRYRVCYVYGYTSALYAIAREALRRGECVPLRVALTNAEPVDAHQKEVISRAFSCPVRETYGMTEMVAAASECEAGNLHLWPEAGIVEVLGDDGALICTGLLNRAMPLIRYKVGDRGRLRDPGETCPCGRGLPVLAEIEGRLDDVLVTPGGRRIGRLDPVFKADLPVREVQIVQESPERLRVRFVPDTPGANHVGDAIAARLRERVGELEIVLEPRAEIPRGPNGKFRAVVSLLPREDA